MHQIAKKIHCNLIHYPVYARHSAHHSEHIVIDRIDADLGSGSATDRGTRKNKLENSIVNAREVATATWLVFFGSQSERIHIDTSVGVAGVVLVRLDNVEVVAFAFRETVLAVELQLGSDNGVLAPAVHVEGGFTEDKGAGIRDGRTRGSDGRISLDESVLVASAVGSVPLGTVGRGSGRSAQDGVNGTGHLEETSGGLDEGVGARGLGGATKSMDGVGESIDGIRVVEGLGTKGLVQDLTTLEGRAVVNVGIGLDNPDELLARMVEVELDLVAGRADRLVTSELELLNQVFVGVLGELATLVRVQKHVIDVQGSGNQGLLVGSGVGDGDARSTSEGVHGPQALTNGAEIDVDLDFVILQGDKRQCQTGVAAKPEKKGNVQGRFGEGVAGSANLGRTTGGSAGAVDVGKPRIRDVGQLGGVTNHLEVASLLLRSQSELVPDVHPVTILAIDALATNLDLNLGNQLLTGEIQPTSIDTGLAADSHILVDLGESHLKVSAESHITVAADGASNTATKVSLTRKGLLNGLHGEVGMSAVRHLPESNLGGSSKEHVLCAVGD